MAESEQLYFAEIHASNNKWVFSKLTEKAANTVKAAFIEGRKFSISDHQTQKDYSFNPDNLVTVIFGEENYG